MKKDKKRKGKGFALVIPVVVRAKNLTILKAEEALNEPGLHLGRR